ncbi:MAG: histidine triad nucleotide-binding protein [Chloroflexi bacterium]|nr:histidine triad nucleotide-binding protein [Chloroflexota bacterium]
MPSCIFCKIISDEAPADILYRDERVTAFRDIHPIASTHILIVPNKHIVSVNEVTPEDETLLGYLFTIAKEIAKQENVAESGYKLIVNTGPDAGQVVFHLHMHLIGGRRIRTR